MTTNRAATATAEIDIDWGVIDGGNTEFSAQYPRLQWVHGSKQSAGFMKTGGLFMPKENYPNFTAEGFEPLVFIARDGTEIDGYGAARANLAVIRVKHQWVKDETYGKNVPLAHILCAIKGCPDLLCITLRGASKALDFQKAFNQHIGQNVALANRTRPQGSNALEPYALWFPLISGEQHTVTAKDGKSSSSVTSPEMFAPANLDRNYVVTLWVGSENYKTFTSFYRETESWQKQPIWEQRNGDADVSDAPPFTGGDGLPPQLADQIAGLIELKGLDAEDVKNMVMTVTDGATSNLRTINKDEAMNLIGMMRVL